MKRTAIAALLVLGSVAVGAQVWNPWEVSWDTPVAAPIPCGWVGNVHTASFSTSVAPPLNGVDAFRETARIYYLCHDGRQFVREFQMNEAPMVPTTPAFRPQTGGREPRFRR